MAIVFMKVVLWWTVILVLAVLNGVLREKFLVPSVGSFSAYIISGITLSASILLVAFLAVPGFAPLTALGYATIGLCWLAMTLAFEFTFGLYVQRKEFSELLQAYTFSGGNIWPVVLLCVVVSPWLTAHIRGEL